MKSVARPPRLLSKRETARESKARFRFCEAFGVRSLGIAFSRGWHLADSCLFCTENSDTDVVRKRRQGNALPRRFARNKGAAMVVNLKCDMLPSPWRFRISRGLIIPISKRCFPAANSAIGFSLV